ncbi:MAG: MFS transporter [Coriobacteriia bacterium]|nr:MFS transporter [Coriobacteriia bacterium]
MMRPSNDIEDRSAKDRIEALETREADVEAPPGRLIRQGTFASFRFRDYRLFWVGSLLSNTGSWMQNYALAVVVYSFRSSELDLGLVNFVAGLPVLFLALPGGALADRIDRRRLLMVAQVVLMFQALALGVLYATGRLSSDNPVLSLVYVAVLGLVAGVAAALTFPAWQAMVPDLVPRDHLLNGIALNSAQFQTARLLGPLVASALLLLGSGMAEVFYANSASFLFVIAALAAIRLAHAQTETLSARRESGGTWKTLTAGLRYARSNRLVGVLIVSTAIMTVFGMPLLMLLPAVTDKALGGGALEVSYLMAANGFGALIGALVVASLPKSVRRERMIPFALVAFGIILIAFSLSRTFVISIALSVLAGAGLLAVNSLTNTSIQAAAPPELRGRVMALFVMSFMGLMPLSSLVFGPLGEVIGPARAVLGGALVLTAWGLLLVARPGMLPAQSAEEDAAPDIAGRRG